MAKFILGITGEMGSGKGTIAKYACQEHGASSHRFSTMLRDVLDRLFIEQSRENIQILSNILRKHYGEDVMAKTMMHEAESDSHDIVIIDGVRRLADITYLRELPHFKLLYVDVEMRTRYERIINRGENTDDLNKTFAEFQVEQEHESELQIRDLKNYADYVIDNNGTYAELYKQIEEIIGKNI